jgi:signal transduction histidine kinase
LSGAWAKITVEDNVPEIPENLGSGAWKSPQPSRQWLGTALVEVIAPLHHGELTLEDAGPD